MNKELQCTEIVAAKSHHNPELPPTQEIKFIAEFLDNFDLDEDIEYNEEGIDVRVANNASNASDVDIVTHKHLEKVGQYLRLGDLEQPVDRSNNFWNKFLRENPHVAEIEGVIEPSDKTSLALEKELLKVGYV